MGVLKAIGYLIAGVAVLTALLTGALAIIVIGIVGGILLDFVGASIFTASALKSYFNDTERSDRE